MHQKTFGYVLFKIGDPPRLLELDLPSQLRENQVLVRVTHSTICATQISQIYSGGKNRQYLPHLLGHEGVGFVEDVWSQESKFRPGDEVILHWRPNSSLIADPISYQHEGLTINSGSIATFASRVIVAESRLTLKPKELPSTLAPLYGCAIPTGYGAILNSSEQFRHKRVVIFGIGAIGYSVAEACMLSGYEDIQGIEENPNRLSVARKGPFSRLFSKPTKYAMHSNNFSRLFVDTTGDRGVLELIMETATANDSIVLLGMPKDPTMPRLPVQKMLDGLSVRGSNGGEAFPERDIPKFHALRQGIIKDSALSKINYFPSSDFTAAVEEMLSGKVMRVGLLFNQQ